MKGVSFYGCSFSDGGGLDMVSWWNHIKDEDWVTDEMKIGYRLKHIPKTMHNDYLIELKSKIRFPHQICERLGIEEYGDHIYTANNNQNVLEDCYKNISEDNGYLHVVQWSVLSRRKHKYKGHNWRLQMGDDIYYENTDMHIRDVDKILPTHQDILINHHDNWLGHIFNRKYEFEKLAMYSHMLDGYAKSMGHKVLFMYYDQPYDSDLLPDSNLNKTLFDDKPLCNYIITNELAIYHETDGKVDDNHFSKHGNDVMADILTPIVYEII